VHGLIKGSAVNHGGSAVSLTAPRVEAQKDVIVAAFASAGIRADSVSYVEAHGTGTSLGDPIEFAALTQAFRAQTDEEQFCFLGSVKTNIGHLEPAAGIAGIIKVILMMKHRQIAPSLHLSKVNPMIDLKRSPFRLVDRLLPWRERNGFLRAGVSSFGFGGVNSHVLLEAVPPNSMEEEGQNYPQPFLLSARTEKSLQAMAESWVHFTEGTEYQNACWNDVTGTMLNRAQFEYRIGLWVDKDRLREALQICKSVNVGDRSKRFQVRLGSLGDLSVAELQKLCGLDDAQSAGMEWGVDPEDEAIIRDFGAQVTLGRCLREWMPDATHFTGEGIGLYAVLCIGGYLNADDVYRFLNSKDESAVLALNRPWSPDSSSGKSKLSREFCSNYFKSLFKKAILTAEQWRSLIDRGMELLPIQHTFRKLFEPWAKLLRWNGTGIAAWMEREAVSSADSAKGQMLVFAVGDALRRLNRKWELPDQEWQSHFAEVLQAVGDRLIQPAELVAFLARGALPSNCFERPGDLKNYPLLQSLLEENESQTIPIRRSALRLARLENSKTEICALLEEVESGNRINVGAFNPYRDGVEGLGRWLVELWTAGVWIDWEKTPFARDFTKVSLPVYSFDRTRFWIGESRDGQIAEEFSLCREKENSKKFAATVHRGNLIESHRIGGELLIPGALWLHFGCRAHFELTGEKVDAVQDFQITLPFRVKAMTETFEVELKATDFKIFANGKLHAKAKVAALVGHPGSVLSKGHFGCIGNRNHDGIYPWFRNLRYDYGRGLQVITGLGAFEDQIVTRIEFCGEDKWNPYLMDGLWQSALVAAFQFEIPVPGLWLPYRVDQIQHWSSCANTLYAVVRKEGISASGAELTISLSAYSESGALSVELEGLHFRRVDSNSLSQRTVSEKSANESSRGESPTDRPIVESAETSCPGAAVSFQMDALKSELRTILVEILQVDAKELDAETDLREYGMESVAFTEYAEAIGNRYEIEVDPVLLYEQPSLDGLARALCGMFPEKFSTPIVSGTVKGESKPSGVESNLAEPSAVRSREIEQTTPRETGTIAIIGISGRFPKSPNLQELWRNLASSKDLITEVPKSRWNVEDYLGDPQEQENKTLSKWGGFIDDVDRFDAGFFKISPREAELMDPQQRWALELTWEALEDAGCSASDLKGRNVGVFVGVCNHDYQDLVAQSSSHGQAQASTGNYFSILPNRISYFFDWRGPSLAIDTACSSSLVALDSAIKALAAGDCEMAIVGGVNLCCTPGAYLSFSHAGMLSPEGRCKSFSAGANGYVRGEGAGFILLKPLDKALADNDPIHAVIRGIAVNHGGTATSLTAPNPAAQAELIVKACRRAGVSAETIGYIEAHGTGTQLGDPIEVAALISAFKELGIGSGTKLPFCGLGSVKTNIGHLESAAGIAGVIKVILAMRHGLIPASLHFEKLNSHIDLNGSPFYIVKEPTPWQPTVAPNGDRIPRRAGVSSFGFGGANAHVILEEPPVRDRVAPTARNELMILSARSEGQLKKAAERLCEWMENSRSDVSWRNIVHTLQTGRVTFEWRLALIAQGVEEAKAMLRSFVEETGNSPNLWVEHTQSKSDIGKLQNTPEDRAFCASLVKVGNLRKLAGFWLSGSRIPFAELFQGGNRISLPSYPFADERYWVGKVGQKRTEIKSKAKEIEKRQVLFQKTWEERPFDHEIQSLQGTYLLIVDGADAEGIRRELEKRTSVSWIVLSSKDGQFDPGELRISGIVHLVGKDGRGDANPGIISIYQRLVSKFGPNGFSVILLTEAVQPWKVSEPSLQGAALIALVRMLGAEYAGIRARAIDVFSFADAANVANIIWEEASREDVSGEVCYREGRRLGPALKEVSDVELLPIRFDPAKVYVITGGTGAIGLILADYLTSRGARKLVLMGRQTLPESGKWKDFLASEQGDVETLDKITKLNGLLERGVTIELCSIPITDPKELASYFHSIRSKRGPIGGVIHCAGEVAREVAAFIHKDPVEFARILSPKVEGTQVIAQQFEADALEFFILFSSISAIVTKLAVGYSDYAVANSFMDFFASRQQLRGRTRFRSVNWPLWEGVGMGRGVNHPKYLEAGLSPISIPEGLNSLERILSLHEPGNIFPASIHENFSASQLLLNRSVPPRIQAEGLGGSLREKVADAFSSGLKIPIADLDPTVPFAELGVDSILLAEITRKLDKVVGKPVDPSLLLEYRNIAALTEHLERNSKFVPSRVPVVDVQPSGKRSLASREPIAVIGMGCRFPLAEDVESFWHNLRQGVNCVREVSNERWSSDRFYNSDPLPGTSISKWGGFLNAIDMFDPAYFGISDEEAEHMDPLARLFLEVSVQCIRNAGYGEKELRGRRVGVFAGSRSSDYTNLIREFRKHTISGIGQNFIAAHVSQFFDFRGPNLVIDSACSSSLTSVHLACQSIWSGESEIAMAGGVDLLLNEKVYLLLTQAKALSPDGQCHTFDVRANGYVPGEGCGIVLLKPLSVALKDGDQIRAVISGSAINNDGCTMGITTPSLDAQQDVIARALACAEAEPGSISYIETHGTGTMIGDPIELKALTEVFRKHTGEKQFCALGSAKTNIGHLHSAAGIASFIKVTLALQHGELPPTLHCDTPNPRFDFAASPFYPNVKLEPWRPRGGRRRGAISSFGFGGTNCHLILEDFDPLKHPACHQWRVPLSPAPFQRKRVWVDADGKAENTFEPAGIEPFLVLQEEE
ncbi:MAG: pks1, partial [Verrucomicrobiales bacterium]|nr:pks1 [Verrucomicrobiales bacterium]